MGFYRNPKDALERLRQLQSEYLTELFRKEQNDLKDFEDLTKIFNIEPNSQKILNNKNPEQIS